MGRDFGFYIILALLLLIEFVSFNSLRQIFLSYFNINKNIFYVLWVTQFLFIIIALVFMILNFRTGNVQKFSYTLPFILSGITLILTIPKVILSFVFIMEFLTSFLIFIIKSLTKFFVDNSNTTLKESFGNTPIERLKFINLIGLFIASIPFFGLIYGMIFGKKQLQFIVKDLYLKNLPKKFDGLKIAHISDLHLGSFDDNVEFVESAIEKINKEDVDLVLFTGDMVNNFAWEAEAFVNSFKKLKSKYGNFSIIGNHDYSDYVPWNDQIKKQENFETLLRYQKEMGFKLLMNENTFLEKDGEKIAIVGVENWGMSHKKGNIKKAMENVNVQDFTILLSHNPEHFEKEILNKTKIDLTLSGHTHGMQMGIKIPGLTWSPVQYVYKYWQGLYNVGDQYIYVNRGLGFIGYPGRVGMLPEVTFLNLKSA